MGSLPSSDLTSAFGEYMQSALGYQNVEVRVPLTGAGGRARAVDLRGETYDGRWKRLNTVSAGAFFLGVAIENARFSPVPGLSHAALANALLAVSLTGFGVAYAGRRRTRRYTWVDCRDRKKPVTARAVQELHDEAHRNETWKPARVFMVSGDAGFDADAIPLATSLHVECYRRVTAGFEQVGHG